MSTNPESDPKVIHRITIGKLKADIADLPDDMEINFSGLEFNRLKQRGDNLMVVEFMEVVYGDSTGKVYVSSAEE